jgi:hypothetical protein
MHIFTDIAACMGNTLFTRFPSTKTGLTAWYCDPGPIIRRTIVSFIQNLRKLFGLINAFDCTKTQSRHHPHYLHLYIIEYLPEVEELFLF